MIGYGTNPKSQPPLSPIINNGFWPDIDPQAFRDEERVDNITDARLKGALQAAMLDINRQLADFQAHQQQSGVMACEAIPLAAWQTPGYFTQLYYRAVFAQAQADLLERYRNAFTTSEGDERGEAKDAAADDYRADARWAIAEMTGRRHTTVELI